MPNPRGSSLLSSRSAHSQRPWPRGPPRALLALQRRERRLGLEVVGLGGSAGEPGVEKVDVLCKDELKAEVNIWVNVLCRLGDLHNGFH